MTAATMVELRRALDDATARLAEAGVASPRHDAEALAAHVLDVPRSRLVTGAAIDAARYADLVRRRAARVPLQHLTGRAGFRRLDLAVGPGVFVPRPETEAVVEWCLDALRQVARPVVVDLCSGSGAIALAIADEHPGATVHAVERESAAVEWLKRNATGTSVSCHRGDVADVDLLPALVGRVDLVVANPPYVPLGRAVDPEVRADPAPAVWGGADGLDGLRLVEAAARRLLRRDGRLAVEHDDRQGTSAPALLRGVAGWGDVTDHPDLTGRPRFVTARWRP